MKKIFIIVAMMFVSSPVLAYYNANMIGVVEDVLTYDDSDLILFRLKNQPATHPACNASLFAIDIGVLPERRKTMLSRLLTSFAAGSPINIGYDNAGNYSSTYIRTHRIG